MWPHAPAQRLVDWYEVSLYYCTLPHATTYNFMRRLVECEAAEADHRIREEDGEGQKIDDAEGTEEREHQKR